MKKTTILISVIAAFSLTSAQAWAQDDDDDDLFGDDQPPGDDDDLGTGTGDDLGTGDTGTGDTGTGDTGTGDTAETGGWPLGIGFSTTVGGLQTLSPGAIEVEYWIGDKLAINGLGRLLFVSPDMGDSVVAIQVGGGALFAFKQRGDAALLVGGRFLLGFTSGDAGTTSIAIEAPLRLQMKLAPRLSAHVEGGLALGIGDQGALSFGGFGTETGESFTLFIGTQNLFGSAGLTAYF